MRKEKYDITGMTCSACSSRVERTVAKLVGEDHVSVNLLTNSMQVEYNETDISSKDIIDAVVKGSVTVSSAGIADTPDAVKDYLARVKDFAAQKARLESSSERDDGDIAFVIRCHF